MLVFIQNLGEDCSIWDSATWGASGMKSWMPEGDSKEPDVWWTGLRHKAAGVPPTSFQPCLLAQPDFVQRGEVERDCQLVHDQDQWKQEVASFRYRRHYLTETTIATEHKCTQRIKEQSDKGLVMLTIHAICLSLQQRLPLPSGPVQPLQALFLHLLKILHDPNPEMQICMASQDQRMQWKWLNIQ